MITILERAAEILREKYDSGQMSTLEYIEAVANIQILIDLNMIRNQLDRTQKLFSERFAAGDETGG